MNIAHNPILRGFNPDPSILRVEDDYYIATSTFEWFPGVQIHHSKDLIHWELIHRPLNRTSQLDMIGNPDSCGVWAPCLSYAEGTYYLVYSNVRSFDGTWKDTPNYLVTAKDIRGDWSDPVFLSASGFDGSMFHDDNGRTWYTSMLMDHRKGKFFGGIILQEFDKRSQTLTGPVYHIFEGTELGNTEGPHLYKKDGYYYLVVAEGGTEYGHAVTVARSKQVKGPYALHPQNPILSSRNDPEAPLQKAGHGDLVQTADGEWYIAFLVGRPLTPHGRCTLGRETAIEKITWPENDWPRLSHGSRVPRTQVEVPDLPLDGTFKKFVRDDFEGPELGIDFQSLRIPVTPDWANLSERPGFLRLYGRESLSSLHRQSMIARRVQHFHIQATTSVEFQPENFQQMAGLVCYYNSAHFHYLMISAERANRVLNIITCDKYDFREPLRSLVHLEDRGPIFLKVDFQREAIQFYYATVPDQWIAVGPVLDGSILSDDYVRDEENRYRPAFTGTFVGICCQDLSGTNIPADFDWFDYEELND